MKRILEVNEKAAFAVVEPGVSFFDLYEHCRTHKLAVWPSMPAIAWGSVLGNVS
jgi:FAD/FMN-containing dehydrogenase